MNRKALYKACIRLLPARHRPHQWFAGEKHRGSALEKQILQVFKAHRVVGGIFAVIKGGQIQFAVGYGEAGKQVPVKENTVFRVASLSKMVTSACVMRLLEEEKINLDEDLRTVLPFQLPMEIPLTLRSLLTHTSGLHDGESYQRLIGQGATAQEILSHEDNLRGEHPPAFEYSNLGGGLIGSALEGLFGCSFEQLMQEHLFSPLEMEATFYPALVKGPLADGIRIFPPPARVAFDARKRQASLPSGWDQCDPNRHHALAQGNCCMGLEAMTNLLNALSKPGFYSEKTLQAMQTPHASFGRRDRRLSQGLGLFVVEDPLLFKHRFYGHQGLAYGAVHGAFFDPVNQDAMVFLSTGASEARDGVLADVNLDFMKIWQDRKQWNESLK